MSQSSRSMAPYAISDAATRGRVYPETAATLDSPFELDRSRILACMAFRRLMHKTQVFVTDCGDHFRTRLTHTLEVVAQAQRLARRLDLNDRLAGAIALAHDLGHPPFGHAGEKALSEFMKDHGGFEHNLQSLRVVDYLEHPYPAFRGLNLTFELRESLIKHRTLYDRPDLARTSDPQFKALMASGPRCPLEGQIVNLADVIAYTLHDIEDAVVEGTIGVDALEKSSLWRIAANPVHQADPSAAVQAIRRPVLDAISEQLVQDAVAESNKRIKSGGVRSPDEVRHASDDLIAFSAQICESLAEMQSILASEVYSHHRVVRMDSKARRLIRDLLQAYVAEPLLMPERFSRRVGEQGLHRVVCDYVAGMTDRYCQEEHRRLYAPFHFG